MRGKNVVGLTVLFLAVGVALAGAQSFLGGVRGAVRDANGVIPGAQVVLTEQQTGATRTVDTNEVGEYVFSAIPAGTYTLQGRRSPDSRPSCRPTFGSARSSS